MNYLTQHIVGMKRGMVFSGVFEEAGHPSSNLHTHTHTHTHTHIH